MTSEIYTLTVNGNDYQILDGHPSESLLWVLRERLELSGSKNACEEGECGSCTVLLDGEIVCSCLVLAASAVGREIVTIEGLGSGNEISDVQQAFVDAGAVQCGFCTPGLLVAIDQLLNTNPDPDDLTVREAISGNLCRCTGYGRILEAVRIASNSRTVQNEEEKGK
ncbi:MAG: (2Fe-2S)-binding protein [Actinomycetota bacterium]|nr:(2Fe-2S)-binding protein [Dehalococcoidia bacterium]MEC7909122.1 (2Fe-2S)-binding protein [Actinomycetota bacterium]|tara:strand:+ start:543 stop:1043 length:501 start_codon:yes stop_codon:yes gene_type:complete